MKRRFIPVPALLLACAASAQAAEYSVLRPAQSQLAFVSRQMGVPVAGQFKRYAVQLAFDPADPGAARAAIDIDLGGVDAGSGEANEELAGRNWFDIRQHPAARFQSTGVRSLGGSSYEVRGPMTIKGKTREVVVPFTFRAAGNDGVFEGGFVLRRLDFNIGQGPWGDTGTVADEVQVRFRFVAGMADKAAPAPGKAGGPGAARKPR